jgi:hypothetical protein
MFFSRILSVAAAMETACTRYERLEDLPRLRPSDLLVVAWDERAPDWAAALAAGDIGKPGGPQLLLCGPHTDIAAHLEARAHGIGPVVARSRVGDAVRSRLRAADSS